MLRHLIAGAACFALPMIASGQVVYLSAEREVRGFTLANNDLRVQTVTDLSPFIALVDGETTFTDINNQPRTNRARSGISCFLDPVAVIATGDLLTQGGVRLGPAGPEEVTGEARFRMELFFRTEAPTPFHLVGSNLDLRNRPGDEYALQLVNAGTDEIIFDFEANPIDDPDVFGLLAPGDYRFRFRTDCSSAGDAALGDFDLRLSVPSPASALIFLAPWLLRARRR